MVFHLHKVLVHSLDVAEGFLPISNGRLVVFRQLVVGFRSLEVEQWSWGLGVAESNLSEAAFNNELPSLWPRFGSLDCSLDLLLHALHVVVTSSALSAVAKPVVSLEQVSLGKLACWLVRVLTWSTPNLGEDLVVEVLSNSRLGSSFLQVAGRSHQLLQLDSSDEVLILRRHQAVVLCQESNLVVPLSSFSIFLEEGRALGLGKLQELLGVCDDHSGKRRTPVVTCRKTASGLRALRSVWNHRLALTGQTVRVLQDLSRLCRWALSLSLCLGWRLALLLGAGLVGLRPLSL
jgi:hypothetical protein